LVIGYAKKKVLKNIMSILPNNNNHRNIKND
jgi:hypothetical protein